MGDKSIKYPSVFRDPPQAPFCDHDSLDQRLLWKTDSLLLNTAEPCYEVGQPGFSVELQVTGIESFPPSSSALVAKKVDIETSLNRAVRSAPAITHETPSPAQSGSHPHRRRLQSPAGHHRGTGRSCPDSERE